MRKITKISTLFLAVVLLLVGCAPKKTDFSKYENVETRWGEFMRAPEGEQKFDLQDMRKIYFSYTVEADKVASVAIDLRTKRLYYNVPEEHINALAPSYSLDDAEIAAVLKILKDENVQKWDKDYDNYSPSDVDTFIWELKMENPDLTAETHGGQATAKEEGIPKNFDAVAKKLLTFAENKANSQM